MTIRLQQAQLHPGGLAPVAVIRTEEGKEYWVDLGWPGLDPARPSIDIFDLDHSGSVTSIGGTDPIGNRFREAGRAIDGVAAWCVTKRSKGVVIHFDQPSRGNTPVLTLNDPGSVRRLKHALRVPDGARGTSDLSPSLATAEEIATAYPDHDIRLTILSDFELTDTDPSDVFARLGAFPGEVHAVVLNAEPPVDLRGENITITRLKYSDPPGALAAAIHRSLTATRRGRRLSPKHADRTQPSIPPLSPDSAPVAGMGS
jgi:hypothetical protein